MNTYKPSNYAVQLMSKIVDGSEPLEVRQSKTKELLNSFNLSEASYFKLMEECKIHGILSARSIAVIF